MKKNRKIEIASIDDQPLNFGKHKGSTPNQVAETDPSYIVWLYENTKACTRDLYLDCEANIEDDSENEDRWMDLHDED